jgi:tRNA pseudouridine38-40 synthase
MTRFRLTVEYDGRPFMGWQRQAHGPSVQQAIEEAVEAITGEKAVLHAAGRTDAGVHALAMAAHVDIARAITPFRLAEGLNARLRPLPVAILEAEAVADDWHARFSCIGRRYLYRIVNRRAPLALEAGRAWKVGVPLDAEAMDKAAQRLVGRHDFTTFRSAHCQSESPVKTLDRLTVRREGDRIEIEAAARSFLHHQVRSMVGCLQLVGRGKWSAADLQAALEAKDRAALGLNAAARRPLFRRRLVSARAEARTDAEASSRA